MQVIFFATLARRIVQLNLLTGDLLATSGICDSTRGGGLYCFGNFTGIASSGTLCGQINQPGVYTQVSSVQ